MANSVNSKERDRRVNVANEAFIMYDFGEGNTCGSSEGWDVSDPEDLIKAVYIEFADADKDAPSEKISFHVRFTSEGVIDEVYALDVRTGNYVGQAGAPATEASYVPVKERSAS